MVGSYAALSGDDGTEEPLLGGRKTKKKKMVKHRIVAVSANRGITETPQKLETGSDRWSSLVQFVLQDHETFSVQLNDGVQLKTQTEPLVLQSQRDPADLAWCV